MFEDRIPQLRLLVSKALWAVKSYAKALNHDSTEAVLNGLIQVENLYKELVLPPATVGGVEMEMTGKVIPTPCPVGGEVLKAPIRTIDDVLQEAYDRPAKISLKLNDPKSIAAKFGIEISLLDAVIVPPKSEIAVISGSGAGLNQVKYQPRIQWVLGALPLMGIYADDIIMHSGILRINQMRQVSYSLIEIPRLGEILVCNQVGEVTYATTSLKGITYYRTATKDDMDEDPSIARLTFTNKGSWLAEIIHVLKTGTVGSKIDVKQLNMLRLAELAVTDFRKSKPEKWPSGNTEKVVINGIDTGLRWVRFDRWFRSKSSPEEYKSLVDYLEKKFNKPKNERMDLSSLVNIVLVYKAVSEFRQKNPKRWPAANKHAVIVNGQDTGLKWWQVVAWFKGLSSPEKYSSFNVYLEQEFNKPRILLSTKLVRQAVRKYRKAHPDKWPTTEGEIAIRANGKKIILGWKKVTRWFENNKVPGYSSFVDFLEREFDKPKRTKTDFSKINIQLVNKAVRELKKASRGKVSIRMRDPVIINGNDSGVKWKEVYSWFARKKGPKGYSSLPDYLEKKFGRVKRKKTDLSKLTIDLVERAVDEFRKDNPGKWPIRDQRSVIINGKDSGYKWWQIDCWFMSKNSPDGYSTLADFLEKKFGKPKQERKELSKLFNVAFLFKAVEQFIATNPGKWPAQNKNPVFIDGLDSGFKWWQFNTWIKSSNGPEKYSSLVDFLEKEFGKVKKGGHTVPN